MNVPKIKGSHTAMKSGMLAAETIYPAVLELKAKQEAEMSKAAEEEEEVKEEEEEDDDDEMMILPEWEAINLESYENAYQKSWVRDELYEVRNVRPSFNSPLKMYGGLATSGLVTMITKGKAVSYTHLTLPTICSV